MVIQAGLDLADILAEAQHHAELVGLHAEEAGKSPRARRRRAMAMTTPMAPRLPPGQHVCSLSWLRRSKSSRSGGVGPDGLRSRAPRPLRAGPPRAAALISPRHRNLPWGRSRRRTGEGYRRTPIALTTQANMSRGGVRPRLSQRRTPIHSIPRLSAQGYIGEVGAVVRGPHGCGRARFPPKPERSGRKTVSPSIAAWTSVISTRSAARHPLRVDVGAADDHDFSGKTPQRIAPRRCHRRCANEVATSAPLA